MTSACSKRRKRRVLQSLSYLTNNDTGYSPRRTSEFDFCRCLTTTDYCHYRNSSFRMILACRILKWTIPNNWRNIESPKNHIPQCDDCIDQQIRDIQHHCWRFWQWDLRSIRHLSVDAIVRTSVVDEDLCNQLLHKDSTQRRDARSWYLLDWHLYCPRRGFVDCHDLRRRERSETNRRFWR